MEIRGSLLCFRSFDAFCCSQVVIVRNGKQSGAASGLVNCADQADFKGRKQCQLTAPMMPLVPVPDTENEK
ncbi:hypothetical protein THS27_22450 [Thalassospira sp. MCCC 1A01428]|nr:hypothetical protein THS27_22450 [Thalassospira sp. MCCC 1A01428]